MSDTLTADDKREITCLAVDSNHSVHGPLFVVGTNGVTKVEGYNEFGGPDYVLWFAVYIGEDVVWRVNGRYVVEVGYGR